MYKCKMLIQNKRARGGQFYLRNVYIKAETDQEAVSNINTIFSSFNFAIDSIKPVILP